MQSHLEPLAVVFSSRPGDLYRAGRTRRAIASFGIEAADASSDSLERLATRMCEARRPVWLLQAGTWPCAKLSIVLPRASASGRPLIAFGRIVAEHGAAGSDGATAWDRLLRRCGGELQPSELFAPDVRRVSLFLEPQAARAIGRRMRQDVTLARAIEQEVLEGAANENGRTAARLSYRIVHSDCLDVFDDERRRVLQVITTLQRGGAERVAIDLAVESPRFGVRSRVATLGKPTRGSFPAPHDTFDVSAIVDRDARIEAVRKEAHGWHADAIHAHLLRGEEIAALSHGGMPVVATVHNARPGWAPGMDSLRTRDAALLIACAQSVESELLRGGSPIPVRTAWNGIDFAPFRTTRQRDAARLRRYWGFGKDDFVLLTLSNPRPQKRWELLPAVLLAARHRFAELRIRRRVRLVVAGETVQLPPVAALCVAEFQRIAADLGVAIDIRLTGLAEDVPGLLAAADALLCTSAYEGLSLAQLEAFAAGKAIVAADVGGTSEIAAEYPACKLVDANASPIEFADALTTMATRRLANVELPASAHSQSSFTRYRMAERYAWLYDRAVARVGYGERKERLRDGAPNLGGLLLIANNFSTGGAQSSARRLLVALKERGVRLRAAVVEEQPDYPTPGRRALMDAGIDVVALPPAGSIDPAHAVRELLELIDADPPHAVLFWNVIAEYKVLLADALTDVRVVDVSPGEMFHASLERYFSRRRSGMPYRTVRDYGRRLDGVVVKYAEEAAVADVLGAPVHVVPNGVPLRALPADDLPARVGQRIVLGTSARLSPQKKLEELIVAVRRAHRRMPPYVLRIAGRVEPGSENYAAQLSRLARGLPVEFVGEFGAPHEFLSELDLFAMISEPAGCPNASLEAMAHGVCVVATDYGGASEQVLDGTTGRLVPRGDCDKLADAIVELAVDRQLRDRLAAAARRHVAEKFSVEQMASAYLRVCGLADGSQEASRVTSLGRNGTVSHREHTRHHPPDAIRRTRSVGSGRT